MPVRLGILRVGFGALPRFGQLAPYGRFEGVGVEGRQRRQHFDGCSRSRRWRFGPTGDGQSHDHGPETQADGGEDFAQVGPIDPPFGFWPIATAGGSFLHSPGLHGS
ncbi:MAG: hypothetical protein IH988_07665 [Planctomycetes bacterium]|nr:hypothetical protein [Planctomycetota bacterium]